MSDLILRSRRVLTPDGCIAAAVYVEGGRIERVGDWSGAPPDASDVEDSIIMAGVIDTHVHVNDPGRAEWEGFETATRAAAAGGVTTILDMPLNSIPATTTVAALEEKRGAAHRHASVNVEYIGGVVPGNPADLEPLRDAGVRAYKCFLTPSGVDEFPAVGAADLRKAFPVLARLGLPLMVHAELPDQLLAPPPNGSARYADYLASRPPDAERAAIELVVRLMDECDVPPRVHIVHLSSPVSLGVIRAARSRGLPLTVETCPHYLAFSAEQIPDGATEYKCAPPIRSSADRDGLWSALIDGEIDLVASDHSPCPPQMKVAGGPDFFAAWGGIASLQFSLPIVWTGARARGADVSRVAEWMSVATARLAGLDRKGRLAAGCDADIVVWNPDESFRVDRTAVLHRHQLTPYLGRELFGVVERTYVGGRMAFERLS